MSAPQPTRAELLERIRNSSKDAVVLDEMQRLGFWPQGEGEPQLATDLITREAQLHQELAGLREEAARYANPERAMRDMRRERMAAARAKREATRRARNEAQHQRALAWHAQRDQRIDWLGEGVSAALHAPAAAPGPTPTPAAPLLQADVDADLFAIFDEEAQGLVHDMVQQLLAWQRSANDPHGQATARDQLLRSASVLAGSARMLGATLLGDTAHRIATDLRALHARGQTGDAQPWLVQVAALADVLTQTRAQTRAGAAPAPHASTHGAQTHAPNARLARHQLPELASPVALATAMGISVPELRFLATHREVSRSTHYQRFTVPKKAGGVRVISAPMPRLKRAQYWVLDNILAKVPVHPAAHGFLPGHGIVSNAQPHADQDVVINLDLQDFFPSVSHPRIKGLFVQLGYGEAVATVLALLCSEARADALVIDGETVHIAGRAKDRVLPQGAPTSPQLTNVLCRRLDARLAALAKQLGFAYTRYADDLSFSASGEAAERVGQLLRRVRWIVRAEGFTPHPDKHSVMRRGRQQSVTGLVVNGAAPSVSRAQRKRLRAALHRAQTQGLAHAHWQQHPVTRAQLMGWAQFVNQVQPAHGRLLVAQAAAILPGADEASVQAVNDLAQAARGTASTRVRFRQAATQGLAPHRAAGTWWQPIAPAAPALALTDQQRREARKAQSPRNRAKAGDAAKARAQSGARTPAGSARSADAAPAESDAADASPAKGRNFVTYLMQLAAAWGLGNLVLHDRRFTLVAFALLVFLYFVRKQSWRTWGVAMAVAWVVAYSLRFLG